MYDYDNFDFLSEEELEDDTTLDNEVKHLLKQAGYDTDLMDDYD